jgi:hypothetical protein
MITSVPASGTIFPFGTTEVDSTATDASGNQASCSFTVTVLGASSVKRDVLAQLIALRATLPCDHGRHGGKGANEEVCQKLDDAIAHLSASLNPAWWIDDTHLQSATGLFVFDEEHATVVQLCFLLNHRSDGVPGALLEGFIGQLNRADHLLAAVAIQEAFQTGAAPRTIDQAQTFLAKGDAAATLDLCRVAIPAYRQAWSIAVRAKPSPPIHPPNGHIQVALPAKPGAPAHRSLN